MLPVPSAHGSSVYSCGKAHSSSFSSYANAHEKRAKVTNLSYTHKNTFTYRKLCPNEHINAHINLSQRTYQSITAQMTNLSQQTYQNISTNYSKSNSTHVKKYATTHLSFPKVAHRSPIGHPKVAHRWSKCPP